MIYSVTGTVMCSDLNSVVIYCNGVGFRCNTTRTTLADVSSVKEDITLFTYMNVREDAIELFGFSTTEELDCFKLLISVSGVGPKVALAVLSELTPDKLFTAVAADDYKTITRAQGVGPKLAQRLLLELKDKVKGFPALKSSSSVSVVTSNTNVSEAMSALIMLGYSQQEAAAGLNGVAENLTVEDMIKAALKKM